MEEERDCVDEETAVAFMAGRLSAIEVQRVEEHADRCSVCRSFLSTLAAVASQSSSEPAVSPLDPTDIGDTPSPVSSVPLFTRGDAVGRYVVLEQVGIGGMGVVYAAYDPELDRKVALKLLRRLRGGQEVARARLIREAQALARLTHPNVVAVHDAGAWQDQVFLAMEFVEGGTVTEWLKAQPRSWRQVLDAYLPAGRGLAAAHARGLVHRDFKPDNLLVGRDGRVLVTDFGLARALGSDDPEERAPSPSTSPPALTQTGAVLGTPGYMAPEQNRGQATDERSDQYSFCVALYEGLHGVRPGQPLPEPRREVPARVDQILTRGLSPDPEQRYPSMRALLDALSVDPHARRRRILTAVGVGLAVAMLATASGVFVMRSIALGRACLGGAARFASVLGPERRQRLQALADAEGADQGELAQESKSRWARLLAQLDNYRRDWIAGYTDACEATRLRHDQSEELLNLRMSCLDARLPAVDVLSGLLEKKDAEAIRRLVSRDVLVPVAPCADRVALEEPVPQPKDPETRKRIEALQARLSRVDALDRAGEFQRASAEDGPLLPEARALGWAPLIAEALYSQGRVEEHRSELKAAERDEMEAVLVAYGARDDVASTPWRTHLTYLVGVLEDHPAEGRKLAKEAAAALARVGANPEVEQNLLDIRASVAEGDRHHDEARALYEQEIAALEKNRPHSYALGRAENNLGVLERNLDHTAAALKHYERALAIEEPIFGAHHPEILRLRYNRLTTFDRPPVDEARDLAEKTALAWGPDGDDTAAALQLYSVALSADPKRRAEAVAPAARALAIFQARLTPDHFNVMMAHGHLGEALLKAERFNEAEAELRQMLSSVESRPNDNHIILREALHLHGEALLGIGRPADARRDFERAQAIAVEPTQYRQKAVIEFGLARTLAAAHEMARARELAGSAVANFEKEPFPGDEELATARAWVAAHR